MMLSVKGAHETNVHHTTV